MTAKGISVIVSDPQYGHRTGYMLASLKKVAAQDVSGVHLVGY